MKGKTFYSFALLMILISAASAVDCPPGFRWDRMSGVGCMQEDCNSVPHGHYGYTGNCVCGSDDCGADPYCVECYAQVNGVTKMVACVKPNTPCPGEKPTTTKATTTTTKATTTTTLSEKDMADLQNETSRIAEALRLNLDQPADSHITRAGIGGDIGGWLQEGWNRLVPQDIISIDDTDAWREWRIVGSDGSFVDVKVGAGTFKVDSEGIKIKFGGLKVDTSSGGGYIKGFTIGEIGVEQSFDPKEVATDKVKEKLTEDMPGAEPVSPDIDWDRISQDIADWFRELKNQAAEAMPEGLKERLEIIKGIGGQGGN